MEDKLEVLENKIEQADLTDESTLNKLYEEISTELGYANTDLDNKIKLMNTKTQTANTRAQNKFKKQYFLISEEYMYHDESTDRNKRGKRLTSDSSSRMIELYIEFMKTEDYEHAKICEDVIKAELKKSQELRKMVKEKNKDISKLQRKMKKREKEQIIEQKKEELLQIFQEYREEVEEQLAYQQRMEKFKENDEEQYIPNIEVSDIENKEKLQQETDETVTLAKEDEEIDIGIEILKIFDSFDKIENDEATGELVNEADSFEEEIDEFSNNDIEGIQEDLQIHEAIEEQEYNADYVETESEIIGDFQEKEPIQDHITELQEIENQVEEEIQGGENIQEEVTEQQDSVDLWLKRFSGWNSEVNEAPQDVKTKLAKIKSDIIKTIKTVLLERKKLQKLNAMKTKEKRGKAI